MILLLPQTVPPSVLDRPRWRMMWMKQCPRPSGSPPPRGRKDWWSADLEGEMEKLEVEGSCSVAERGPMVLQGRRTTGQLGRCLQKELKTRNREWRWTRSETQPSSNETDGGFVMCEVEEQQAARVEVQGPKRRVIRVESEETQDYARERLAHEEISQEDADEIGFVPSALSEPRGAFYWCDNRCSDEALRYLQIASVVNPAQSICAKATIQRKTCSAG